MKLFTLGFLIKNVEDDNYPTRVEQRKYLEIVRELYPQLFLNARLGEKNRHAHALEAFIDIPVEMAAEFMMKNLLELGLVYEVVRHIPSIRLGEFLISYEGVIYPMDTWLSCPLFVQPTNTLPTK